MGKKIIVTIVTLVSFLAATFTVLHFIAGYDILSNLKQFISNPFRHFKEVEKKKKEELVEQIGEKIDKKIDEKIEKINLKTEPDVEARPNTLLIIGIMVVTLAVGIFVFFKFFYSSGRSNRYRDLEDLFIDELWEDDRHLYS